jgi:hypothetical protein
MSVETTIETILLLEKLVAVALKAKGFNPSPVEIKQELAELDEELLLQVSEDLNRVKQTKKA